MKYLIRLLVLLAISASLSAAPAAMAQDETPTTPTTPAAPTTPATPTTPAVTAQPVAQPATPPVIPPAAYRVKPADPAKPPTPSTLGSLIDAKLLVEFSPWGAGIHRVQTADYRKNIDTTEPYTVIEALKRTHDANGIPIAPDQQVVIERPFQANALFIDGQHRISLYNQGWELIAPGQYRIQIIDAAGNNAITITRTYSLGKDNEAYDLTCRTDIQNHTARAMSVVFEQNAHGDLAAEAGYMGDVRRIVAGYHNLDYDPAKVDVYTDDANHSRVAVLDEHAKSGATIWPDADVAVPNELLWIAITNRYFTAVIHRPVPPPPADGKSRAVGVPLHDLFEPLVGMTVEGALVQKVDHRQLMLTLSTKAIPLAPGEGKHFDLSLYAGPRLKKILNDEPYATLKLGQHLVRYELGCTICLFQGLADFLLAFLTLIHSIVFDWGFAIIVLVLVVRLLLHPITKKAQINMTRMSKQMASVQPEMAKIKERYKSDPARQQQEMLKLYREKGINPMGFLGCLPMFLQMPIWVALYAMLFGAIELRHEPAFWGFFQLFGDWAFLKDLSEVDYFIKFNDGRTALPLCGLQITHSINILPILMAVVFYFQQKLTMPPATNEQMAQQQKIMRYMTLLFPVLFYAAPSGLTLYIMASSLAGIVDSYIVRKHIKREEEAGTLFQKKPPKPGGFFDKMQKMLEAKQKEMEAKKAELSGKRPGEKKRK